MEDCIEKELEYYELNVVKHIHHHPETMTGNLSRPFSNPLTSMATRKPSRRKSNDPSSSDDDDQDDFMSSSSASSFDEDEVSISEQDEDYNPKSKPKA